MPPKLRPIKKKIKLTSKPPQHTFENDQNHRSFLSRSMAKSDTELNAIIKLNSSLSGLKEYIVQHFGMDVLLDIGEGFITLSSSNEPSAADATVADDSTRTSKNGEEGDNEYEEVERLVFKEKTFPLMQKSSENIGTSGTASKSPCTSVNSNKDGNEVKASSPVDNVKDVDNNDVQKDNKDVESGISTEMENETETSSKKEEEKDALNTTAPALDDEQTNEKNRDQTVRNSYYSKLQKDPTFKPIIKNFILRLKLRRKLLNRLARRLLRLNHAMDGKLHKINPPMLPKYGTSFEKHVTADIKDRVNEWNKDFECREEVLEKLWRKKEELAKAMIIQKKKNDLLAVQKKLEDEKEEQELLKEKLEDKQKEGGEEKEGVDKMEIDSNQNKENGAVKIEATSEKVNHDNEGTVADSTNTLDVSPQQGVKKEPEMTTTLSTTSTNMEKEVQQEKGTSTDMDIDQNENTGAENAETSTKNVDDDTIVNNGKNDILEEVQTKDDNEHTTAATKHAESQSDKVSDTTMEDVSEQGGNTNINQEEEKGKEGVEEVGKEDNKEDSIMEAKQEEGKSNEASDTAMEDVSEEGGDCDVKEEEEKEKELTVEKITTRPDPPETEESKPKGLTKQPSPSSVIKENNKIEESIPHTSDSTENISLFPSPHHPFFFDTEHHKDMEKLIQYDTDYTKKSTTHIPTGSIIKTTTALTKEELAALDKDEDDFDDSAAVNKKNMNHGIGAISKFMTKTEKVMEWKRWQAEFLSKIPDQPTFEELGMRNRVFFLEERRKLIKINKESAKDQKEKEGGNEEVNMEEENNDVDKKEGATSKKRPREDHSDDEDEQNKDNDLKGKEKKSRKEKKIMKQKYISLDPVPSFHHQDYSRILMIQSATLSAALSNTSRETFLQAKTEYEQIFKRSQELQTKKTSLENELAKATYDYRLKVNNIKNTIAMAKVKWETEKKAFEKQKVQRIQMKAQMMRNSPSAAIKEAQAMSNNQIVERTLSAAVDRAVIRNASNNHSSGSRATMMRLHHTPTRSIQHQVAMTMSQCIDVVVRRTENGWLPDAIIDEGKYGESFPQFVPPASSNPDFIVLNANGETISKIQKRLNASVSQVKSLLDASEAARSKAWSKLNKAQVVLNNRPVANTPSKQQTKSNRQKASVTTPKHPNPKSVQKQKASQPKPAYTSPATIAKNPAVASAAAAAEAVKATMNSGKSQTASSASENKYSLERVRARMYSDGSVLPVSLPKKGKDGLYLRPAGRQRKGMNWDAVNGKWVPKDFSANPEH